MHPDYIMRMIEQFMQALISIIRARKAENYEEAFHQIQNASKRYLNKDIVEFLKMNHDEVLGHFKYDGKNIDADQCIICADLLYETALVCKSERREDLSIQAKISALNLYLNAIPMEKEYQALSYMSKVNELTTDLENHVLPNSVKKNLDSYQKFMDERGASSAS